MTQSSGNAVIGVDKKDPGEAGFVETEIAQVSKVVLRRMDDSEFGGGDNFFRFGDSVVGGIIDEEDLVTPTNGFEAGGDVSGLVASQDNGSDFESAKNLGRRSRDFSSF